MPLKLVKRHDSGFWYIRGTVRGVTVDESTRLTDEEAAEALRSKREWEITQGAVFGRRAVVTFLEAAVMYMDAGNEARFLKPILEKLGRKRLADIDQNLIDITARQIYPNATNATRNRQFYTPVSAVLKFAHERGLCGLLNIKRPKQPSGRVRYISLKEADRLIDAAADHLKPLLVFLFYTGSRLSEALYLEWDQVDLKRAHVSFLETKNGETRGVPLHPRVVAALANIEKRNSTSVFRRPDGMPYKYTEDGGGQIKTAFKGACRRAGITDFRPHDCRHTWATWHYAANRDLGALMKLGGWKTERMVLRYAHVNVGELARTIEALPWGISGDPEGSVKNKSTKTGV